MIYDNVNKANIAEIIQTSKRISSIPYEQIVKKYPNPNYLFQLKNKPFFIVIFFTQIHRKKYNKLLFNLLYKLLKQNDYPESTENIIKRLETLIMNNSLYSFINPKEHYSINHGDFIMQNLILKQEDQSIKVFDWATFTTGPHFIDIARFISSSLVPYSEVKELYLDNEETGGDLSLIEKIFFLYSLILLYLLRLKKKATESKQEIYIKPALKDMEDLVSLFMETEYEQSLHSLVDKRE